MRNNFTFSASIKLKKLDRMENLIDFLYSEKVSNDDLEICKSFRNLLDSFDKDLKSIKTYEVIDSFANFYENKLLPYCRNKLIIIDRFECFDFEQTQYVMDKMSEIIDILCGEYGIL